MAEEYQTGKTANSVTSGDRNIRSTDFSSHSGDNVLATAQFLGNFYPDAVLMLSKTHHPEVAYVSRNCQHILGHPSSRIINLTKDEIAALIHPDDVGPAIDCYKQIERIRHSKDYRPDNYRFAIQYRWKTAAGAYICICEEKRGFLYEEGAYIHYSVVRQVEERNFKCVLTVYKKNSNSVWKIMENLPSGAIS